MSQTPNYNLSNLRSNGSGQVRRVDTMVDDNLYINQKYDQLNGSVGSVDSQSNIKNMKIRKQLLVSTDNEMINQKVIHGLNTSTMPQTNMVTSQ
jgi:ABC-type oligopeptide transport system substrate-binding subunit